ncbi:MAG: SHOCT domain-containing protein [Candidatus Hydrothermarchaeales archaeon]
MSGMMGYGFGGGMMLFGFIFWILIIVGIVLLVKWLVEQSKGATVPAGETALDILKKRYAKGEIGKEEFEEKKKDLI